MAADDSGQDIMPPGAGGSAAPVAGPEPTKSNRWLRFAGSVVVGAGLMLLVLYLDDRSSTHSACKADDECEKGQFCSANRCDKLPTHGQACAPGDRCAEGLRCKSAAQICTDLTPIVDGQACSHSFQCDDASYCNEGHVCAPREKSPPAPAPSR